MGNDNLEKGTFITCPVCGKRVIERKKNGLFHFIFGKPSKTDKGFVPVEMFIQGNIKIKCLRRTCGHWFTLNYLPNIFQSDETPNQVVQGQRKSSLMK